MGLGRQRGHARADVHAAALVLRAVATVRCIGEASGMDRDELGQLGLPFWLERVPCHVLVGVQGVAAGRWNIHRIETCSRWRTSLKAPVSMPVLGKQRRLLVSLAADRGDVLPSGDRGEERIVTEPAEIEREPLKIVVVDILIGEGEDVVFEPGLSHRRDGRGIKWLRQVEPGDPRPARAARRLDSQGHSSFASGGAVSVSATSVSSPSSSSPVSISRTALTTCS